MRPLSFLFFHPPCFIDQSPAGLEAHFVQRVHDLCARHDGPVAGVQVNAGGHVQQARQHWEQRDGEKRRHTFQRQAQATTEQQF